MTNHTASRRLLLGGLAGLPLLAACGTSNSDSGGGKGGGTPIKVGYIPDSSGGSIPAIANKQGMWAKHGLSATMVSFASGPVAIQALGTGDVDFAYIGSGALWLPMSGKAKIVGITNLSSADRIIARQGISTIKDLAGKSVAVPEGTSGDMLLNLVLRKNGMAMTDVKRVVMQPATIVSAFASGQVDAAAIWYPFVGTIAKQKPDLVELAKSADFPELAFPSSFVAAPDITSKPEQLKAFQAVLKEATTWRHDNKDALIDLMTTFLKAPKETVTQEQTVAQVLTPADLSAKSTDGTVATWLDTLSELFTTIGKVDKPLKASEYYLGAEYAAA